MRANTQGICTECQTIGIDKDWGKECGEESINDQALELPQGKERGRAAEAGV